jgi:hypothetical protein
MAVAFQVLIEPQAKTGFGQHTSSCGGSQNFRCTSDTTRPFTGARFSFGSAPPIAAGLPLRGGLLK